MSNETIERAARESGVTVDQLQREASARMLARHAPPEARAAILRREARREGRLVESTPKQISSSKKAAKTAAVEPVTEAELEGAFKGLGHDDRGAKIAAQGRYVPAAKSRSLIDEGKRLGLSAAKAKTFARGRMSEAVTDGSGFRATDYAYAGDENDPSTWKLLLAKEPGDGATGAYDPDLVKAAATAIIATDLGGAPQVDIPEADLARVKQTLAGAWVQSGLPSTDMPPALTQEALRAAFVKLGLSPEVATIAAKGR